MKPTAKKGLMIIGVLYAVTVVLMVAQFTMAAKPTEPEATVEQLRAQLNTVREWAYGRDPEHIRKSEITPQEASEVMSSLLLRKGTIINVNYTLIMQALNFAILLLILYGLLWDPMLAFLDKRAATISKSLEEAAAQRLHAHQLREARHAELETLRKERGEIMDQAKATAEQERRQIVEHARQEAERTLQQTRDRLGEEVRRARGALREEIAEFSTRIAEQILQREVSQVDHDKLIDQMVEQLVRETDASPVDGEA